MTTICKKAAQHFHCAVWKVFDRMKSVALGLQISENWPRTIRATVLQLLSSVLVWSLEACSKATLSYISHPLDSHFPVAIQSFTHRTLSYQYRVFCPTWFIICILALVITWREFDTIFVLSFENDFFPDNQVSSTNKTSHYDIAEMLLKVTLNTHKPTKFVINAYR
jgi:hypothetical protein